MSKKNRPNILLITSDQHRADCYGFEGRNIRTPHLDRMATNGTRFSAAITPNLVCQPARASILTGLLPLTLARRTWVHIPARPPMVRQSHGSNRPIFRRTGMDPTWDSMRLN